MFYENSAVQKLPRVVGPREILPGLYCIKPVSLRKYIFYAKIFAKSL